jgi:hypothetical protein
MVLVTRAGPGRHRTDLTTVCRGTRTVGQGPDRGTGWRSWAGSYRSERRPDGPAEGRVIGYGRGTAAV